MSCYFRYLKEIFAEAGVTLTPANKRQLDQAIHAFVHVPYKHCMPECWSGLKAALQETSKRAALIAALKRVRSSR